MLIEGVEIGGGEGVALGVAGGVGVNEGVAVGTGERVWVKEGLTVAVGEADGVGEEIGSAGASAVPQATRTQHPAPITHNLARIKSVPPP
jgi:hypothetical protein